jgi:hypothetical protein
MAVLAANADRAATRDGMFVSDFMSRSLRFCDERFVHLAARFAITLVAFEVRLLDDARELLAVQNAGLAQVNLHRVQGFN